LLSILTLADHGDEVLGMLFEETQIKPNDTPSHLLPPPDTEGAESSLTYTSAPKDDFGPEVKVELSGATGILPKQPTKVLEDAHVRVSSLGSE
jgi:hypothetical protein